MAPDSADRSEDPARRRSGDPRRSPVLARRGAPFSWEFLLLLAPPLLIAVTFLRVGLLALFALLLMDMLIRVPLTLDPDAWYFGNSLVVLLGFAALATYSFLISLGGRPAFGGAVSGPPVSGR